ncbi:MAG: hypothetical protein ACI9DE_002897, partial [Halioglobus sp.]
MSPETVAALFATCLLAGFAGAIAAYAAPATRSRLIAAAPP